LLFVALLGIIWVAILLPSRLRRRSPRSSVEEFERKMNSLAETHNTSPGRWVLMPRKGQKIMDPGERRRFRIRRRRRVIFVTLLELTVLALVMGLFPPLHRMLVGAAGLGGVLVLYSLLLARVRRRETELARISRIHEQANGRGERRAPGAYAAALRARSGGSSRPSTYAAAEATRNGTGGGRSSRAPWDVEPADSWTGIARPQYSPGGEIRVLDDDVHVVVYRSDELEARPLQPASSR
jgi:hypothetical protein